MSSISINIKDLIDEAESHLKSKNYTEAERTCRETLENKPYNTDALLLMSKIFFQQKNYRVAEFYFNYVPQKHEIGSLLFGASILLQLNNLEKAKTYYFSAYKIDPRNIEALCGLAKVLLLQKNYEDSMKCLKAAIILDEGNSGANALVAEILLLNNSFEEARKHAQKALVTDKNNAEAFWILGRINYAAGNFDEARICMKNAVEADGELAKRNECNLLIAKICKELGQVDEARRYLRQIAPQSVSNVNEVMELFSKCGLNEEAKVMEKNIGFVKLRSEKNIPSFVGNDFLEIYSRNREATMVNWDALYTNFCPARYVVESGIEGDVVECGVLEGGSIILLAESLKLFGDVSRKVFLYDTFEGMSDPTDLDIMLSDPNTSAKNMHFKGMGKANISRLNKNLDTMDYAKSNVVIVKGKVEDTIPGIMPEKISILRLDTDWYESTLHELEHLYPRLSVGGILIIDDYSCWAGSRVALEEYIKKHGLKLFFKTDIIQGSVTAVKMPI